MLLRVLTNDNRNMALQRKGMKNYHVLADIRCEMLLKAVGQLLCTAK
jgi:hypothetical protein